MLWNRFALQTSRRHLARLRCIPATTAAVTRRLPFRRSFSSYTDFDDDEDYDIPKTALVVGSSGSLGKTLTIYLAQHQNVRVIGADVVPNKESMLDDFISMPARNKHSGLGDVTAALARGVSEALGDDGDLDAIICASGGWQGDPPIPKIEDSEDEFLQGASTYGDTIDQMLEMNLYPVLAAGYTANRFMAHEGRPSSTITSSYPVHSHLSSHPRRLICCHWSNCGTFSDPRIVGIWFEQSRCSSFCANVR